MGNRVESFIHKVGSVMVGWYIRKSKGRADEMFSWEMASKVNLLSLRIVEGILRNVDISGIICHNPYQEFITELCECVEVTDCLTRSGG